MNIMVGIDGPFCCHSVLLVQFISVSETTIELSILFFFFKIDNCVRTRRDLRLLFNLS